MSVSAWIVALVLSTAVFHAGWNAVLRHSRDRLLATAMIALGGAAVAAMFLPFLPWPGRPSLPFMLASFALHTVYRLLLIFAYRWGELGVVYPIARGSAPLLVTGAAAIFAGEHLGVPALGAIAVISLGILALSQSHLATAPWRAPVIAVATGAVIAGYSVVDGIGARLAPSAFSYAFWLEATECLPWIFVLLSRRGALRGQGDMGETWRAIAGGVVSILAYALVVWAMTRGALGIVSALRETSVVFAALIGWLFLGERLTWRRLLTCCGIAVGIVMLGVLR
jgi:drug/metabolite transporter (DMT)-like permease